MKLIHLSDLHIGKRVHNVSMLEDQKYMLEEILSILEEQRPDGVILAGDIYDKAVPSTEAVEVFDEFLYRLAKQKTPVFIIAGNHDSPERLAFGNRLIDASGIHISPVYDGHVKPFALNDEFGPVHFYLLPFVKPVHVRRFFPEEEIGTYTDAIRAAVAHMDVDPTARNVLVCHQFVTGAARSDSEEVSVGGVDNVDAAVFQDFDYVALGHIHGPQNVGSDRIRYCGTPLKYSFSEAKQQKSLTVVELSEKGNLQISTLPLSPLHEMRELRGTFDEVMDRNFYKGTTYPEDYVHITLTDEMDQLDVMPKLRIIYHNLLEFNYDNPRTRYRNPTEFSVQPESKSPLTLFSEFYKQQTGRDMISEQEAYLSNLIDQIWEEKV